MYFTILDKEFINEYKNKPSPIEEGLGSVVFYRTYSRIKENGKSEEFYEVIERVVNGLYHIKFNHYKENNIDWNEDKEKKEAENLYKDLFDIKFLPGGRVLYSLGTPITEKKKLYAALFNCSGVSTQNIDKEYSKPFKFCMDMSMVGAGVGFDCLGAGKLTIHKPLEPYQTHIIEDSREGWVNAFGILLDQYFKKNQTKTIFDYSKIRKAGTKLNTFGGTASGPEILIEEFDEIRNLLENNIGNKITSRIIVDIMNMICKVVIAGNIRRSASIAIGDYNDTDFINLKNYDKNPERMKYGWLSNNSINAQIGMNYNEVGEQIPIRGEPGLLWLDNMRKYSRMNGEIDNKDKNAFGCNPCYTGDMLIYTDKGFIRIDECVGKTLKLFNGEEFTDALIRETGQNKEVYKVIFSDGSFVKCTNNHNFILKDGTRKELKDLNNNDELYNPEILKCDNEGIELEEKYIKENLDNLNLIYNYSLKTRLIYLTFLIQKYGNIDVNKDNLIINKYDYNIKLLLETLGIKSNIKYNKIFINSYYVNKLLKLYYNNKINYSYILFGIKSNEEEINEKLFIVSKEKIGIEDKVYCATTLNDSHKFNCNGIIGGNCGEITLNSYELCNLSEVFINRINDYEEFKRVIKNAFIFTKIISLCKTHWEEINKNMEKNRRCGVSLTGIVNFIENKGMNSLYEWTTKGYKELKEFDKELSKEFNVNESIKITCIKPSGSISLLVPNTPPGLHYPIYRYYIRRVRINEHATKLLKSLEDKGYYIENSETEPNTKIVNFVVDSKCKRSVDDVSMWEQLELAAKLQEWWADNQVSITVSFDPKTESKDIKHALDLYQYKLKGVSFLGKIDIDNNEFKQLPYEKITKEKYDELLEDINKRKKDVNIEIDENDQEEELFCTSNSCDLKQYKKMFRKNVIIISGLTGSGKSFIAQKVKDYFNTLKKKSIIISKDDYRYTEKGYLYTPEHEIYVNEEYNKKLEKELKEHNYKYIILDNTHIGNKLQNTIDYINKFDIDYVVVSIIPFEDLNNHCNYNIHKVPLDAIEKQNNAFNQSMNLKCPKIELKHNGNTWFNTEQVNKLLIELKELFE